MNTTNENLYRFLTKNLFINPLVVQAHKSFRNDLGLSSIEFLEMINLLEHQYQVNFPDQELDKIKTVGDLSALLTKYQLVSEYA
jgi:acyl carrier protein